MMNKKSLFISLFFVFLFSSVVGVQSQSIDPPTNVYRMFFQNVEDDIRMTGCVNLGGTCYQAEETVVQDCKDSHGNWIPCGWE